ncbi:MAG: hypothetical protein ACOC8N_01470 [Spirochaetota bacterium]
MPNHKGQTSIFRIKDLSENEIWDIGALIEGECERRLKARGDININEIVKNRNGTNLEVIPSTDFHERHADIVNWPEDKVEQRIIASELAMKAILRIR